MGDILIGDSKRYQVFLSSTYLDLREERQAVITALLQLDAFPSGMELFPAADDDAWTLIKRVIDDCDYYLLVIGGKYGSLDPAEDISYTEKEFDYALKVGKPIMAFLHGDEPSIPVGKAELDPLARDKLSNFRSKVRNAKHVRFWTSPESLAAQVTTTYVRFAKLYEATGWVRADQQTSAESLAEIAGLRKRISELEASLHEAATSAPAGSEELAQGEEEYGFLANVTAEYQPANGLAIGARGWERIEVSWNDLLQAVGPNLLDECEQERLRSALGKGLENDYLFAPVAPLWEALLKDIKKRAKVEEVDLSRVTNWEIGVEEDDFGTILLQFLALGLIAKSERKRSVADKGTYWKLTPFGMNRLVHLRAVKRAQQPSEIVRQRT
ncbi:DUF4062 domain-containing protein [Micromonospora lupini]|uniref:DUF4062 domain-containing protein n=1 Tax=Micromonospora lupini str. Lupac 08 TaxID=1150864 RepID=I0KVI0_9ACTN|nr:DUF4062 domain-containing protein [Micromonospora lupini]CCH15577.1 Conserved hypothetical protein [Micromonospora lupini str. Lupac 08]